MLFIADIEKLFKFICLGHREGDFEGWRRVFQRRIAKLSDVKNESKTRNSPRWANKILKPPPENSFFQDCKKF